MFAQQVWQVRCTCFRPALSLFVFLLRLQVHVGLLAVAAAMIVIFVSGVIALWCATMYIWRWWW